MPRTPPLPVDPYADLTDLGRLNLSDDRLNRQSSSYDRTGGNADAIFWYYLRPASPGDHGRRPRTGLHLADLGHRL